jgi:hypothetical protein
MPEFNDRTGETKTATNGQKMTIINYRCANDIDIKFEDGTIVKNKLYQNFKLGNIKNPNAFNKRIGETKKANSGMKMTIIAYRSYTDIDVQFEDGTIIKNRSYREFKKGSIKHPNITNVIQYRNTNNRCGKSNLAKCGMKMTIIRYGNVHDIDVQFEDGTVVLNKDYRAFKSGGIKNPNFLSNKLGETNINSQGQKMTIITYKTYNDIDVQFEDGTIVTNKKYNLFEKGMIKNPNYKVGEMRIASNEQKMTIIKYRTYNDIDVQFEDGTIVKNKSYSNFKKGTIANPNNLSINTNLKIAKEKWINDTKLNIKNGLKMTIIDYNSYKDITILFETGYKLLNINMTRYMRGNIKHPFPYQMDNILIEKNAYVHNSTGIGNFYCKCNKCGYRDIWTIENAKNHKCEEIKK